MDNEIIGFIQYTAKVVVNEDKKKCILHAKSITQGVEILIDWYKDNASNIRVISMAETDQGIILENAEVIEEGEIYSTKFAVHDNESVNALKIMVQASNVPEAEEIISNTMASRGYDNVSMEEIKITSYDEIIPLEFSKQHGS